MHTKPLTEIQQDWINHINQATAKNLSMSAYAKQNNLALKSFYNARSSLMKKGILPSTNNNYLIPLIAPPVNSPAIITSCRITLCNAVVIELADVDLVDLLNSASQL